MDLKSTDPVQRDGNAESETKCTVPMDTTQYSLLRTARDVEPVDSAFDLVEAERRTVELEIVNLNPSSTNQFIEVTEVVLKDGPHVDDPSFESVLNLTDLTVVPVVEESLPELLGNRGNFRSPRLVENCSVEPSPKASADLMSEEEALQANVHTVCTGEVGSSAKATLEPEPNMTLRSSEERDEIVSCISERFANERDVDDEVSVEILQDNYDSEKSKPLPKRRKTETPSGGTPYKALSTLHKTGVKQVKQITYSKKTPREAKPQGMRAHIRITPHPLSVKWSKLIIENGVVTCPIQYCQRQFKEAKTLKRHYQWCQADQKKFQKCPFCLQIEQVDSSGDLAKHVKKMHVESLLDYLRVYSPISRLPARRSVKKQAKNIIPDSKIKEGSDITVEQQVPCMVFSGMEKDLEIFSSKTTENLQRANNICQNSNIVKCIIPDKMAEKIRTMEDSAPHVTTENSNNTQVVECNHVMEVSEETFETSQKTNPAFLLLNERNSQKHVEMSDLAMNQKDQSNLVTAEQSLNKSECQNQKCEKATNVQDISVLNTEKCKPSESAIQDEITSNSDQSTCAVSTKKFNLALKNQDDAQNKTNLSVKQIASTLNTSSNEKLKQLSCEEKVIDVENNSLSGEWKEHTRFENSASLFSKKDMQGIEKHETEKNEDNSHASPDVIIVPEVEEIKEEISYAESYSSDTDLDGNLTDEEKSVFNSIEKVLDSVSQNYCSEEKTVIEDNKALSRKQLKAPVEELETFEVSVEDQNQPPGGKCRGSLLTSVQVLDFNMKHDKEDIADVPRKVLMLNFSTKSSTPESERPSTQSSSFPKESRRRKLELKSLRLKPKLNKSTKPKEKASNNVLEVFAPVQKSETLYSPEISLRLNPKPKLNKSTKPKEKASNSVVETFAPVQKSETLYSPEISETIFTNIKRRWSYVEGTGQTKQQKTSEEVHASEEKELVVNNRKINKTSKKKSKTRKPKYPWAKWKQQLKEHGNIPCEYEGCDRVFMSVGGMCYHSSKCLYKEPKNSDGISYSPANEVPVPSNDETSSR